MMTSLVPTHGHIWQIFKSVSRLGVTKPSVRTALTKQVEQQWFILFLDQSTRTTLVTIYINVKKIKINHRISLESTTRIQFAPPPLKKTKQKNKNQYLV